MLEKLEKKIKGLEAEKEKLTKKRDKKQRELDEIDALIKEKECEILPLSEKISEYKKLMDEWEKKLNKRIEVWTQETSALIGDNESMQDSTENVSVDVSLTGLENQ